MKELVLMSEVNILLKMHPKYNYQNQFSDLLGPSAVTVVEKDVFPDCDLVLVYNPFLGYEYQSLGYEVIFFDDAKSVADYIRQVKKLCDNKLISIC